MTQEELKARYSQAAAELGDLTYRMANMEKRARELRGLMDGLNEASEKLVALGAKNGAETDTAEAA